MSQPCKHVLAFVVATILAAGLGKAAYAGPYDTAIQKGITYLESTQSENDGSWQSTGSKLRFLETAEAVIALEAVNRRTHVYFSGITWLANHAANNLDYQARRAIALQKHNANTTPDITAIQLTSRLNIAGSNGGYGLSAVYEGSVWDTALALQALAASIVHTQEAISGIAYLKSAQLATTPRGWAVSSDGTFNATATAQVLLALAAHTTKDSSLAPVITSGSDALKAQVTTSNSPIRTKALATLAYMKARSATDAYATNMVSTLLSAQAVDGHWGSGVYDTALVMQVLAVAARHDIAAAKTIVDIPDEQLRHAINQALGRNAMDQLNQGELAQLTTLNMNNRGITNLTGLQYATNLTALFAANNSITDPTPIAGLTQLRTADLSGNPCPQCDTVLASLTNGDTPLPLWALGMLGAGLMVPRPPVRNTFAS